jgi:hypothetical protein
MVVLIWVGVNLNPRDLGDDRGYRVAFEKCRRRRFVLREVEPKPAPLEAEGCGTQRSVRVDGRRRGVVGASNSRLTIGVGIQQPCREYSGVR